MTEQLTVGGRKIPLDDAKAFARNYLSGEGNWAYPAYDAYPGHPGTDVGHADLLAVALLNAHQRPLDSYYGLESLIPLINERLADPALQGSLADANAATLDAIARLFGVLDEKRPKYVSLTKLSKVLHRKRPELIPLYDKNISRCYADEGLDPRDRSRSWHDYSRLLLAAMKRDLADQIDNWMEIADLATHVKITPLRAMDIVGWHLGR
ncbi:DUF6308 family protein [Arthrobacter sp. BF1]|uniref:DUF6308 family protein n=1 Tax=Arthrobacter sp. BF1 TaxID=2821145 RepID=UPI001C4F281F|nr:DUF6308 family protein [Arthrobacter sp. BF1]